MSFRNSIILFAAFMAAGLSSYFSVKNGYYPAAIVNFDVITAKSWDKNFSLAYKYFQNLLLISGSDPSQLEDKKNSLEIKRAVLDNLISDSLIYKELDHRLKNEYQSIAENKIEQAIKNNTNLPASVKIIYGLELPEFKKQVLLPQAYREILAGRLFLNNEDFDDWLKNKRAAARVIIFAPDLRWDGNEVKLRD